MSKKLLAIFMALIMVLGSTVMAGAEEVPAETARMNEIAEEVIETLPDDMKNKDFEIVEGEDNGFSTALVATEPATAETVQGLIDDGTIVAGEFEIEGLNVEVVEMDAIVPLVEEDGKLYNALTGRAAGYTETNWASGWKGNEDNGVTIWGNVYAYKYTNTAGSLLAIRPTSFGAKYYGTPFTPTKMTVTYGAVTSYVRAYPGYLNGTNTTLYDMDYYCSKEQSNPTPSTAYSFTPTGLSGKCLQLVGNQAMTIRLYVGSVIRAEVNPVFSL